MLKTLIGRSAQPDDLKILSLYVIAASFPKMLRRMQGRIPKRYFDCLLNLKSTTFGFIEQPDIVTTNGKNPDRLFLNIIPNLKPGITKTDISNLRQIAKDGVETPCKIYNENTYMEFHGLLCELLERFYDSLEKLKEVQKSTPLLDSDSIIAKLKSTEVLGRYLRAMVRSSAIENPLRTYWTWTMMKSRQR
jgi:hypothetical protein